MPSDEDQYVQNEQSQETIYKPVVGSVGRDGAAEGAADGEGVGILVGTVGNSLGRRVIVGLSVFDAMNPKSAHFMEKALH